MSRAAFAATAAAAALLSGTAAAQAAPQPFVLARLAGPVVVDGHSNEPAWAGVEPLPLTVHTPTSGAAPRERTEIRVAYDDDALYAAWRLYDRTPGEIRSNTLARDRWSGDDAVNLVVDALNDNQNAILFQTTPSGNRSEAAFANDLSGSGTTTWAFNTFWDVATARDSAGWYVEMRIPFSSLRFRAGDDGRVVMGISASRLLVRADETQTFPAFRPGDNELRPSLLQDVELRGVHARRPVYIAPYVLAGYDQQWALDADRTGYAGAQRVAREMGLDAKVGLGSAGTLDVTLNTDFAQVEADDPQVNLTRYGVLYPERRPFFLERADLFTFPTHRGTGLFYSRRIGLSDAGSPVPITAGARLAARAAGWDVGALGVRTGGEGGLPGEWFGVGRARRQVLNRHSAVGMMGTLRANADGGPAAALAGDARLRVRGDDYLTLVWAQAWNDSTAVSLDAARAVASWERRAPRGVNGELYALRTGGGYDPALGYVRARGTTEVGGRVAHRWVRAGAGPLRAHSLGLTAGREVRHADGGWESGSLGLQWEAQTRRGAVLLLGASTQRQDLASPFALPRGVTVPAGEHRYPVLTADYEPAYRGRLRVGGGVETGGFYDGARTTVSTRTTWNVSRHLEVRGNYSFNRVRFSERDQGFNAHTALVRATMAVDTRLSAIGTLQWNSVARQAGGQMRVRYNLREGHDVYVVYGEGWNTERDDLTPLPPVTSTRRLMIKYTRNVTLGG